MNPDILDKILRAIIVFLHVEKLGCTNSSWKRVMTSRFLHVSHATDLEDPRTSQNPASFTANMGMGSGGNINRNAFSLWA